MYYNLFLSLFGYGTAKRDYEIIPDQTRFLILIAAHNEEAVIASTVENLRLIDYNKELFDIVVVNDNSTDGTKAECERVGVLHVNTDEGKFPREAVGKPGGLQYAVRSLGFEKIMEKYEMVLILDADNHVDSNILKEINSQYIAKGKPDAIQTYLDSKNYGKMLSLGYAMSYVNTNRFFQLSKYRLGLPNALGGTGFAVTTKYLIGSGGFNYKSLTEDLEMEVEIVCNGGKVLWNHFTRIYDEKPEELRMSIRQRTRWMQGHWFVAFTYGGRLLTSFFKEFKWKYIDQMIYLFAIGKSFQAIFLVLSFLFSAFCMIFGVNNALSSYVTTRLYTSIFSITGVSILLFIYAILWQSFYALRKDSNIKFSWKIIIAIYYYAYTFLYCQIVGLLKWRQQKTWVKTEHKYKEKQ